jgi:transcriptional regulator with XRE-family HTH domain
MGDMRVQAVRNFRVNAKHAMQARGWSQYVLAEKTELSRPFINRVFQGKQDPSLEICDRIADALDLPLPDLLASPKNFLKNLPAAIAG